MVTVQGTPAISPSVQTVRIGHQAEFTCTYDVTAQNFYALKWYFRKPGAYLGDSVFTQYRSRNYITSRLRGRLLAINKGNILRIASMRITRVEMSDNGIYTCYLYPKNEHEGGVRAKWVWLHVTGKYKL